MLFPNINSMLETFRGTVHPWECDVFQHMNVQYYIAKFDQASWQFLGQIGITPEYMRQNNRGMVAMEQRIRYFKELVAGDLIEIRSEPQELRSKSFRFRHLMYNTLTQDLCAEIEIISVHINTISRKSIEFSAATKARLQVALDKKDATKKEGAN